MPARKGGGGPKKLTAQIRFEEQVVKGQALMCTKVLEDTRAEAAKQLAEVLITLFHQ